MQCVWDYVHAIDFDGRFATIDREQRGNHCATWALSTFTTREAYGSPT
jgi:hypothetical protein